MTVAVIAFTRRGAALGKTLAAALGGTLAAPALAPCPPCLRGGADPTHPPHYPPQQTPAPGAARPRLGGIPLLYVSQYGGKVSPWSFRPLFPAGPPPGSPAPGGGPPW